MRLTILNRAGAHPADGFYHIEPAGVHPGKCEDGTAVEQVIDAEAVTAIVAAFNRTADADGFPGMLIDREHFSHQRDKETAAEGWLMRLENRAGQLYGKIDWTPRGKAAVDGKEYRFFSTEYDPENLQTLNRATGVPPVIRVRPLVLSGLTLTNRPNNRGGKPITNRDASPTNTTNKTRSMKQIANRLGLAPEASEESILTKLDEVLGKSKVADQVTLENTTLKNRVTELLGEQIDADLAVAGIKDAAAIALLTPVLTGMKNREERTTFLKLMAPASATDSKGAGKTPLTNRESAKTPASQVATAEAGEAKPEEVAHAKAIQNRASEIMGKDRNLGALAAWNQATRELA